MGGFGSDQHRCHWCNLKVSGLFCSLLQVWPHWFRSRPWALPNVSETDSCCSVCWIAAFSFHRRQDITRSKYLKQRGRNLLWSAFLIYRWGRHMRPFKTLCVNAVLGCSHVFPSRFQRKKQLNDCNFIYSLSTKVTEWELISYISVDICIHWWIVCFTAVRNNSVQKGRPDESSFGVVLWFSSRFGE